MMTSSQVEGVSFSGYIFSRAFNFDCVGESRHSHTFRASGAEKNQTLSGSFPTGPTTQGPTQAPPSTCYNGLLLPGDASTPASCMCSDVWTGTQCTVPVVSALGHRFRESSSRTRFRFR